MSADDPLSEVVDNLVYEPVQVHDGRIDLTVGAVYDVAGPGRLDFGGDELEDADLEPVGTEAREPDDEYEWWHLTEGTYLVQYNEFLGDSDDTLVLQPRGELLARGCSHPTVHVSSHLPLVPLSIASGGLKLKENARISTLVPV